MEHLLNVIPGMWKLKHRSEGDWISIKNPDDFYKHGITVNIKKSMKV